MFKSLKNYIAKLDIVEIGYSLYLLFVLFYVFSIILSPIYIFFQRKTRNSSQVSSLQDSTINSNSKNSNSSGSLTLPASQTNSANQNSVSSSNQETILKSKSSLQNDSSVSQISNSQKIYSQSIIGDLKDNYEIITKKYSANLEKKGIGQEDNSCQIEYPQLNMQNKKVETKINQLLSSKNECENIKDMNTIQDFEINYRNNNFLSLRKCDYRYYREAAHGMYNCQNFNFDLQTGENLNLEKFIKKDGFTKISELALEYFKKKNFDEAVNLKLFTGTDTIPVNEESNFYITNDKLVLYFGQYEIAPYASGSFELEISILNIQNLLTNKWGIVNT